MAHGIAWTSLVVIAGISVSSVSRYMQWRIFVLHDILQNILAATTTCPPAMYLQQIGAIAGNLYGEVMRGCIIITDGSLHALEKDERAQSNYFYDEHQPWLQWMEELLL
jgi:hypothetical protein